MGSVIGLFLTMWFLGKLFSDSLKGKAFDVNFEKRRAAEEDFMNKYVKFFSLHDFYVACDEDETIMPNLAAEIEEAIGYEPDINMLHWGYLAKEGKIPYHIASTSQKTAESIRTNMFNSTYRFLKEDPQYVPSLESQNAKLKFLQWYDKTLQENGVEFPLMCIEWDEKTMSGHKRQLRYSRRKSIQKCTKPRWAAFFWEPIMFSMDCTGWNYVVEP